MLSVKSGKQAPAPIWSGDHGRKNEKIALTCTDPNAGARYHNCHMSPWHHKCSVPLALAKFSAPGTIRVKCPWHLQSSVPLALSLSSLHSPYPHEWVLIPPLLPGCQSALGWLWNFPSCCGVPHCLHVPPGNIVDCGYTGHSAPHW